MASRESRMSSHTPDSLKHLLKDLIAVCFELAQCAAVEVNRLLLFVLDLD